MPTPGISKQAAVITFVLAAAAVAGLDLWTKDFIFKLLKVEEIGTPPRVDRQEEMVIVEDWFELEANYNYGAFSGWFSRHTGWLALLSAAALLVIAAIFIHQLRQPRGPRFLFTLALGLLCGGTLGNLYDRYFLGAVRDWIKWFYVDARGNPHVWPNFNIADSAICTGVGLLILLEIMNAVREKKATREAAKRVGSPGSQ